MQEQLNKSKNYNLRSVQERYRFRFGLFTANSTLQLCLEIYISSNSRNLLQFLLFSCCTQRRKEENLIKNHTPFSMVSEIHPETSSLRTLKVMPKNLNKIESSWIRLQNGCQSIGENCFTPYGLRNPYRNLKSENSQDYAQKPQQNCMFMNSASEWLSMLNLPLVHRRELLSLRWLSMVRAMTSRSSLIHPTLALHLTGHVFARDDKKHFLHGRL